MSIIDKYDPRTVFGETDSSDVEPPRILIAPNRHRSEEHTSELQSLVNLVCRLLLE